MGSKMKVREEKKTKNNNKITNLFIANSMHTFITLRVTEVAYNAPGINLE